MKKGYKAGACIVLVILYIVLLCLGVKSAMPALENTMDTADITANGTFLFIENGIVFNSVYEINSQGQIVNRYQKLKHFWNNPEQMMDISYSDDEDKVYLLCRQRAKDDKTKYKVYCLDSQWKKAKNLGSISKKSTFEVKDFNVAEDGVYLTGVDTAQEKLQVYTLNEEESGKMELLMERGALADGESGQNIYWVSAAFSGKSLYGLSNRGQFFEYNQENETPFSLGEMGEVTWMCGNHDDIIYYDYMEDMFASVEDTLFLELVEGKQGVLSVSYARDTGDAMVVRRNGEGNKEVTLYLEDGEYYVDKIFMKTIPCLLRICFIAVIIAVVFACVLLALAILWYLLHKFVKRPVLTVGIVLENMLLAFVLCVLFYQMGTEQIVKSYGVSAATYLKEEQMKCSQLMAEYTEIIPEEFSESQWFGLMKNLLNVWEAQEEEKSISYQIDMVEYEGEDSYILYSDKYSYGRNIYGIYEKELLKQLEEIKSGDGKGTVCIRNKNENIIYAVEFLEENDNNCLLWVAKMQIKAE